MAATEEEKRAAAAHLSAAIDSSRHFPQNVFRGEWHVFLFFDSDRILLVPEAIYAVHALLEAEGGSCAVFQQTSRVPLPTGPSATLLAEPPGLARTVNLQSLRRIS